MKKLLSVLTLASILAPSLAAGALWSGSRPKLPDVLSASDAEIYAILFDLQDKGNFAAAKKLELQIEDNILMGDVLYQRYMSKTYATSGAELTAWMKEYYDQPGADKIFGLAKKRHALTRAPALPAASNANSEYGAYNESLTAKEYYGQIKSQMNRFHSMVKKRKTLVAKNILLDPSFKKHITDEDYGRLAGRLAFAYYIDGAFDHATVWGMAAAELNSEYGLWTMGLMAYKNKDFAAAEKYFEKMLELEHVSTNRKVEAAFWAGRAAEAEDDSRAAKKHWKFATTRPASFYGAMAAAKLGREPRYKFYESVLSRDDIAELVKTDYGRRALALIKIDRKNLAENHLKYLITNAASDGLLHAVHALATSEELPRTALSVAPVIKERGILEIDSDVILSAQYPLPSWQPRGGWNIDRALLFAIARQESSFKSNAKSHAGATGLLQLMPRTAKITAVKSGVKINSLDLTDPEDSMFLGQQHVLDLFALENVGNNIIKMLVSYNAGNGHLRKFERRFETDDPLLYIESFPATETRDYVKKVMSNLWLYRARLRQPMGNLTDLAFGRWPTYTAQDDFAKRDKNDSEL